MAGSRISVDVENADLQKMLQRVAALGGPSAWNELLLDIGPDLVRRHQERAADEVAPDGTPWMPLSPAYAAWKERKRPGVQILKFDNHMLGDMFSYQIDGAELLIGTNAAWGATHQFGSDDGRRIPARPFLGLSDDDVRAMGEIVAEHLADLTRGRQG